MALVRALMSINTGDGHGGIRSIAAGDLLAASESFVQANPTMFEPVDEAPKPTNIPFRREPETRGRR